MICSRCKKRPAVVFITRMENGQTLNDGLCLFCARELNIKPVNDMMEKMGLSDEDLEQMSGQLDDMMQSLTAGEQSPDEPLEGEDATEEISENGDSFKPGGAATFPLFNGLFGGRPGKQTPPKKGEPPKRRFLSQYCTDLTEKARSGKIDTIIGRDREIYRVVQILCRRTKNNPCLIGEPGVGKTAIAEGLALRIAAGDVPYRLRDKEIHLLDLTALVAGTQFRGQFESRIKGLIDEVRAEGNIILFIDEVHTLSGTGDSEGSMSAANILKPSLSRGEIQVIGATTFSEYRKYIEKDAALERRFQPVTVEEPSLADATEMLLGVRSFYEQFHGVKLSEQLVRRAVQLSERYITDRFLPDKAIDMIDEACAAAALRNKTADTYAELQKQIAKLQADELSQKEAEAVDYEALSAVRSELMRVQQQADAIKEAATEAPVTEDDLAHVVELWTGIPAAKVQESTLPKLAGLENALREKIKGQEEAIALVAAAIRRTRVQISPRRRPASFIFVGPTGVGKTELVKVLTDQLFDTPDALIRLDMSEYMEKYAASRILGSPPGYVGYDEAGQLTEKVRRKPYSVVLFDEIEKAHPDVLNILLQILDEGRVTDSHGRVVNFENTVIVMTSNAGSSHTENLLGFGRTAQEGSRDKAMKALSEFLRPEFLARVDEIVCFDPLNGGTMLEISRLMLEELVAPLSDKGIALTWDTAVEQWLTDRSTGGKRGARDLRATIRRYVEDSVALLLVDRWENPPKALSLTVENDSIIVKEAD